jgi:predicted site-specific integrase-resolvase
LSGTDEPSGVDATPIPDRLLTQTEAAEFLRVDVGTLRRWGLDGPPCIRVGTKFLRYSANQLSRWCEERTRAGIAAG